MSSSNNIKVVCRFRPPNTTELKEGGDLIVDFANDEELALDCREFQGSFAFDRVFTTTSQQNEVFNYSIRPTVDDILNGYNGTVFAYGQTGSGKTYTMMGMDIDDEKYKGVIPRIVEQVFESILSSPPNIEYTVKVSYMEIYMERIRDLLNPASDNLPIHEEKNRGVYVKGLLEVYVSSVQEVYEVMRRGAQTRATASTNMNTESSRSHSIFVVTVTQKNVETGSAKSGQLFLVDLAGSEKVGKTGASGQTLEEAKKINKSLSALGMVINALTDGRSTHIPYRDSKLTRILQESLGGNSRTTLIINCSPCAYNDTETLSTLRFGTRAKTIKNKAKVNSELSPAELKTQLRKAKDTLLTYEEYCKNLENEVTLWRDGTPVAKESWVQFKPIESHSAVGNLRQTAGTPSRQQQSPTPGPGLDKDEKEEFLRRENELQDQIAEKESQLSEQQRIAQALRDELQVVKDHDSQTTKTNENLSSELNEVRLMLEKSDFEGKEAQISIDGMREANTELSNELEDLRQQLMQLRMQASEHPEDDKEKRKSDKVKELMAGFDTDRSAVTKLKEAAQRLDQIGSLSPEEANELKSRLSEAENILKLSQDTYQNQVGEIAEMEHRESVLRADLKSAQDRYKEIISAKLAEKGQDELVKELESGFNERIEERDRELAQLKKDLESKKSSALASNDAAGQSHDQLIQQQMKEFDEMKKKLMVDLQSRCERVIELEVSLDETKEQYNNVLRGSNNRAQQKKMAFLERNLEQLTSVQRQLVEQNSTLKKDVAIAERKLSARNERIQHLETMLQDAQDKLTHQNNRFESQLQAVRERLEQARVNRPTASQSGAGMIGSRIAKPLRGSGPVEPEQKPASAANNSNRSSWFFTKR